MPFLRSEVELLSPREKRRPWRGYAASVRARAVRTDTGLSLSFLPLATMTDLKNYIV